jgi:hypothetical protein
MDRNGDGAVNDAGWVSRALIGVVAITGGCATVLLAGVQAAVPASPAATTMAVSDIPASHFDAYRSAATRCPGLSWTVLAGVGRVESDHGRDAGPSPTGAIGPMQFEPATWASYGIDADGDGRADPRNPADATAAAADYLCALGIVDDLRDALIAYNCGSSRPSCQVASAGYAASVLSWAAQYGSAPMTGPVGAGPVAALAPQTALAQVGTPYLWGGAEPGGFDCSGLVRYAYAAAGLQLPRVAQDQYDAGPVLPPDTALVAGDLVFFGAGRRAVEHVGIYLGGGQMVDAPHTGALVRVEPVNLTSAEYVGATRPDAAGTT